MDAHKRRALPEGWEWKRLGDVATVGAGNSAPQGDEFFVDGEYPFVRTQDVGREKATICLINTTDRINELAVKEFNLKLWPAKTLLIPKSGESTFLNRRALLGVPSFVSSHLATVIAGNNLAPEYLYFWSLTVDAKKLTHDINYPSLRLSELESAKIPLPPLPIQRRIVSILEKAEETKRLRAQADELTDRLLQSVFLEMFGDPVKNPKGWEIEQIDKVCSKVTDGEHNIPPRTENGIPLLMATNVRDGHVDLTEVSYISEGDHQKSMKRCNPEEGDVLLVCVGATIGRVAIVPKMGKFSLVRSVALLKPNNNKITSQYLLWCLKTKSFQYRLLSRRNTSAQAGLYLNELKKIKLPIPPLFLQQKFARIVEKIESMRQSQNQSKQQIEDLFSALMQKAFRGELDKSIYV